MKNIFTDEVECFAVVESTIYYYYCIEICLFLSVISRVILFIRHMITFHSVSFEGSGISSSVIDHRRSSKVWGTASHTHTHTHTHTKMAYQFSTANSQTWTMR
jgi:hypothetical protein